MKRTKTRPALAIGATCAALLLGAGCSPTLGPYLEQLDPASAVLAKSRAEPRRSDSPVIARNVVVCRFTDDRAWSDTFHVGAAVADFFAGVFSLGFAAIYDGMHQQHRNQPIAGLEKELPRRLADCLTDANTFTSCRFVDHTLEGLKYLKGERALPAATDCVLVGSVRQFTGEWDAPPNAENGVRTKLPLTGFRGRIEAVVTLADARTRVELWSSPVAVTVALDDVAWSLKDDTECTLKNKLAVASVGAFLREVEATLRAKLPEALPTR